MATQSGSRAAHTQSMISGRKWDERQQNNRTNVRTTVWLRPGLLAMAEQHKVISRYGRNGGQSFSDWVQDRLIDAIREKERKNNPVSGT